MNVQEMVDEMWLSRRSVRPRDGKLHPSSLAGCHRKAVYEASNTEPTDDTDVRNIRIMGVGTQTHEHLQEEMKSHLPGSLFEVLIQHGGIVEGSVDALVPVGDGVSDDVDEMVPVYELWEIKSVAPYKMSRIRKSGTPEDGHMRQSRMYYAILDGLLDHGYGPGHDFLMDGIRIVYVDRNDWSVLEYEIDPWTPEEVDKFRFEIMDLRVHLEEGTLPERLQKKKELWLCKYCPFSTRCWEQDGEYERGG